MKATYQPLITEQTRSRQVNALQDNALRTAQAVNAQPWAGAARLLENVALPAGGVLVLDHGLRRPVRGWVALNMRGAFSELWSEPYDSAADNARHLRLHSSAAATADIMVW